MIPELPEFENVPALTSAVPGRLRRPQVPVIGSGFSMASGKAEAAEEYAAAMGQAFQISRMQAKRQKAKARARGRAAQRAAEKRKRR